MLLLWYVRSSPISLIRSPHVICQDAKADLLFLTLLAYLIQANHAGAREAAFKAAIADRDAEIAKLQSANKTLEMEKSGVSMFFATPNAIAPVNATSGRSLTVSIPTLKNANTQRRSRPQAIQSRTGSTP